MLVCGQRGREQALPGRQWPVGTDAQAEASKRGRRRVHSAGPPPGQRPGGWAGGAGQPVAAGAGEGASGQARDGGQGLGPRGHGGTWASPWSELGATGPAGTLPEPLGPCPGCCAAGVLGQEQALPGQDAEAGRGLLTPARQRVSAWTQGELSRELVPCRLCAGPAHGDCQATSPSSMLMTTALQIGNASVFLRFNGRFIFRFTRRTHHTRS